MTVWVGCEWGFSWLSCVVMTEESIRLHNPCDEAQLLDNIIIMVSLWLL